MSGVLRTIGAGLGAGAAYLVAQEIDRRITNPRSNDLILVGGLVTCRPELWRPLGLLNHMLASVTFAFFFEWIVAPRLFGPYWLRGMLTFQAENASFWPLVLLIDRLHPAVKTGDMARLNQPVYFAQEVWRHLAFGIVLGALLTPPSENDEVEAALTRS
jgi:hypothetical protein